MAGGPGGRRVTGGLEEVPDPSAARLQKIGKMEEGVFVQSMLPYIPAGE